MYPQRTIRGGASIPSSRVKGNRLVLVQRDFGGGKKNQIFPTVRVLGRNPESQCVLVAHGNAKDSQKSVAVGKKSGALS